MNRQRERLICLVFCILLTVLMQGCTQPERPLDKAPPKTTQSWPDQNITVTDEGKKHAEEKIAEARDLLKIGRTADAHRLFTESISLDPHNIDGYKELAALFIAHRDYIQAQEAYSRALNIEPENLQLLDNYGITLMMQNKFNEEAEVRGKIFYRDTQNIDNFKAYAYSLERSGEYEKLEDLYNLWFDNHPGETGITMYYGRYWFRRGSFLADDADEDTKTALKYYGNAASRFNLVYRKSEKAGEKAEAKFNEALSIYRKWKITKDFNQEKNAIKALEEYKTEFPKHKWVESADHLIFEINETAPPVSPDNTYYNPPGSPGQPLPSHGHEAKP